MRFRYRLWYRLRYLPKVSVSDLNQNSGFSRTLNLTLIPTNCSWSTTQESRYTNEMLVAKRAMTSVHPSALSALMYRKFVNSQRKENPHDLQQNFPAKINTKHSAIYSAPWFLKIKVLRNEGLFQTLEKFQVLQNFFFFQYTWFFFQFVTWIFFRFIP